MRACYEDPLARLAAEVTPPEGPRPESDPADAGPHLAAELDRAETDPVAWALPLVPSWWGEGWASPAWRTRRGRLVLVPGDITRGYPAASGSLSWGTRTSRGSVYVRPVAADRRGRSARAVVVDPGETEARTALVVQARDGFVYVFLPPLEKLEKFVELVGMMEPGGRADPDRRSYGRLRPAA